MIQDPDDEVLPNDLPLAGSKGGLIVEGEVLESENPSEFLKNVTSSSGSAVMDLMNTPPNGRPQGSFIDLRFDSSQLCCQEEDPSFPQEPCVSQVCVLTSSNPDDPDPPLLGAVADEVDLRAYAVIDSGATETVGSLSALDALMSARYEIHGHAEDFRISDVPPRRFRFGHGALGFSVSHILLPQDLGDARVDLGVYTLDAERVPILLGVRTLRSLRTVIDFHQDTPVFAVQIERGGF